MLILNDKQAQELNALIGEIPGKYTLIFKALFDKFAQENAQAADQTKKPEVEVAQLEAVE